MGGSISCCSPARGRLTADRAAAGLSAHRGGGVGTPRARAAGAAHPAAGAVDPVGEPVRLLVRGLAAAPFDGEFPLGKSENLMVAFVLIHSPFVGKLTWQATARALADRGHIVVTPALNAEAARSPYWPHYASCVAAAARSVPEPEPLVLVAHSAAGLLIPASRAAMVERTMRGYVFVDATVPRGAASLVELIPMGVGITMEQLQAQAKGGYLPPWGTDWPDELWQQLIPDVALRECFVQELCPTPLALYEEHPPVVPGWPDAPCSYVRLSALYTDPEAQARRAGWPTREVNGGHLHMLVDPAAVACMLTELAS